MSGGCNLYRWAHGSFGIGFYDLLGSAQGGNYGLGIFDELFFIHADFTEACMDERGSLFGFQSQSICREILGFFDVVNKSPVFGVWHQALWP